MVAMDWGPWGGGDRGALGIYRRVETVAGLFRRAHFPGALAHVANVDKRNFKCSQVNPESPRATIAGRAM